MKLGKDPSTANKQGEQPGANADRMGRSAYLKAMECRLQLFHHSIREIRKLNELLRQQVNNLSTHQEGGLR